MNHAYPANKQGRRYLSEDGKVYKSQIILKTQVEKNKQNFVPDSQFYGLNLAFGFTNFFNKDGSVCKKRPDSSNCIKLLEDAIFEGLGLNDRLVIESSQIVLKENFKEDFIQVSIKKL